MAEAGGGNNDTADALLSQFMAFTGSSDAAKAASYLEMSSNNVETAVGLFMEHEGGGGGGFDAGGGGIADSSGGSGGGGLAGLGGGGGGGVGVGFGPADEIRAPDATRRMQLMDDDHTGGHPLMMMGGMMGGMGGGMGMGGGPFHLMNAMMDEEIANAAAAPGAFAAPPPAADMDARAVLDAAIAAQRQQGGGGGSRRRRSSARGSMPPEEGDGKENHDDSDEDDEDYVAPAGAAAGAAAAAADNAPARLSNLFVNPTHLMHTAGGFQGARAMAKDTKRWLLVNIQRDSEFASHALNRDVWRDELVENLVREGFIFWQQSDSHPEGRTYTERYSVRDYPHLGIIDPRTGRLLWRKEGWTQENPVTPETFAESAMDFCSRNSFDRPPQAPRPPGAPAPRPAKRSVNEMSEAAQLEAAMRASMEDVTPLADDNDDDGDGEIQYPDSEMDDDDDEVEVLDSKPEAAASAAAEGVVPPPPPVAVNANEALLNYTVPDEPADGSRIQFRMPDGKRAVHKFGATDSVRVIYAFFAQNNEEASNGQEFVLMAGYPPHDLISDMEDTIEGAKLTGQMITVRFK